MHFAKELLKKGREFTALFAMSDVMAIGATRALLDAGKRVPEDVSVLGLDGLEIGNYLIPRLATVCQSLDTLVQESLALLLAKIEKNEGFRHVNVPVYLEWKESARKID